MWRVFVYLASLSNVHTYRGAKYIAAGISGEEETSAEGKQLGLCLRPRRSVSNIPKIRVIHARSPVIILDSSRLCCLSPPPSPPPVFAVVDAEPAAVLDGTPDNGCLTSLRVAQLTILPIVGEDSLRKRQGVV